MGPPPSPHPAGDVPGTIQVQAQVPVADLAAGSLRPHGACRPVRAAGLGAVLTAGGAVLTLALARQTLATWPGISAPGVEAALLAVTLAAATLLSCWVSLVLSLAVLDLLRDGRLGSGPEARGTGPGGAARSRTASEPVRRVGALLLALTAGPAPTALAGPPAGLPEPSWTSVVSSDAAPGHAASLGAAVGLATGAADASAGAPADAVSAQERPLLPDGSPVPVPGWTPSPAAAPTAATSAATIGLVSAAPQEELPEHVVVRAGDTLWAIAARHLGPDATVRDVAEEWPRWYHANLDVIGQDPDLILPGQELVIPAPGNVGATADGGAGR